MTLNKTILITGASAGIGLATAESFAKLGWSLVLGARRLENLEKSKKNLLELGAQKVLVLPLDVTNETSVNVFTKKALEFSAHGIDVLFNNAGLALGVDKLADTNILESSVVMETNVMGLLRVTRAILPSMISKKSGHIINMGSIAGFLVYEGGGVYCASKHAVRALTKTLRLELNGTPIRVTSIDPGMVETEFSEVRLKSTERAKAVYQGITPLSAHDIAECVTWSALRPTHVNIDEIVVMPVDQAAPHKVNRVK